MCIPLQPLEYLKKLYHTVTFFKSTFYPLRTQSPPHVFNPAPCDWSIWKTSQSKTTSFVSLFWSSLPIGMWLFSFLLKQYNYLLFSYLDGKDFVTSGCKSFMLKASTYNKVCAYYAYDYCCSNVCSSKGKRSNTVYFISKVYIVVVVLYSQRNLWSVKIGDLNGVGCKGCKGSSIFPAWNGRCLCLEGRLI